MQVRRPSILTAPVMRTPLVRATLILVVGSEIAGQLNAASLVFCIGVGLFCYFVAPAVIQHRPAGPAPTLFLVAASLSLFSSATMSQWLRTASASQNISRYCLEKSPLSIHLLARVRFVEIRGNNISVVLDRLVIDQKRGSFSISGRLKTAFQLSEGRFDPDSIRPGAQVELSGRLLPLPWKSNPHDFDEGSFLRSRGIDGILVPDGYIHRRKTRPSVFGGLQDPSTWLIQLRDRLTRHLLSVHESSAARQLMPAMLLGQRYLLESEVRNQFRKSGLSHLLAISGLHVGILGYSFFWLTGLYLSRLRFPFRVQRWLRAVLSITLLFLFSVLAGGSASVVRASVMGSVLILGTAVERTHIGLNSLGAAAFLLLFFDPFLIRTPGFQLSFIAVGTILMLGTDSISVSRRGAAHPFLISFVSALRTSFWIFCTTFPVVSFHFGSAPSGGILSNLIAIPLASFLMISGLISTLFSFAGLPLWSFFVSATDVLSELMLSVAFYSSSLFESPLLEASGFESPQGNFSFLSLAPAALFILYRMRGSSVRSKMLWATMGVMALSLTDHLQSRGSFITFLYVGQGDATISRSSQGNCFAVDTGSGYASSSSILRHAKALGCDHLDPVIISHAHIDHIGGLERLINSGFVRSVVVAFQDEDPEKESDWRKAARAKGVHVNLVSAGDVLSIDHSMKLYFLSPSVAFARAKSANNSSIVVLLRTAYSSLLFTGDAERMQERDLIARYGDLLVSDVVKVAHHGSATSSIMPFVERVVIPGGTAAVISSGRKNRFGHPSRPVVTRWKKAGADVLLTAEQGAITFKIESGRIVRE